VVNFAMLPMPSLYSDTSYGHNIYFNAAKIQNVLDMVISLQHFLIQFSRFLSENHKKHIKYNLLSERNRDKNTIRR
ncbi:MAG: hypothetical protein VZQ98_14235, partial [Bacteroidales bacterium]|nr:hypothetical protein [Bacteroidales bacterium]